jgi:hypothetical protein
MLWLVDAVRTDLSSVSGTHSSEYVALGKRQGKWKYSNKETNRGNKLRNKHEIKEPRQEEEERELSK